MTGRRSASTVESSFWGDISLLEIFQDGETDFLNIINSEIAITTELLERSDGPAGKASEGMIPGPEDTGTEEQISKTEDTGAANIGQSTHKQPQTDDYRIPAGELASLRQRYISGKLAGDDLYGSSGKLIISKGKVITADVIEKAESEGKLSELIINMILPE